MTTLRPMLVGVVIALCGIVGLLSPPSAVFADCDRITAECTEQACEQLPGVWVNVPILCSGSFVPMKCRSCVAVMPADGGFQAGQQQHKQAFRQVCHNETTGQREFHNSCGNAYADHDENCQNDCPWLIGTCSQVQAVEC